MGNMIIRDICDLLHMMSFQHIVGVWGLAINITIIKQLYPPINRLPLDNTYLKVERNVLMGK